MVQTLTVLSLSLLVLSSTVFQNLSLSKTSSFSLKKNNLIKLRISISNQEFLNPFLKKLNVLFSSYYENIHSKPSVHKKSKLLPQDHLEIWYISQELAKHTKKAAILFIDKI